MKKSLQNPNKSIAKQNEKWLKKDEALINASKTRNKKGIRFAYWGSKPVRRKAHLSELP
jgi:hypothetical protein